MKKEIKLSKDYIMLLSVQYVKNVSEGKKSYEIRSKIVNKEEYVKDEQCIGEIQGAYFIVVPVHSTHIAFLKNRNKIFLKKRVNSAIKGCYIRSKKLVEEWEQNTEVMKEVESFIANMQ